MTSKNPRALLAASLSVVGIALGLAVAPAPAQASEAQNADTVRAEATGVSQTQAWIDKH